MAGLVNSFVDSRSDIYLQVGAQLEAMSDRRCCFSLKMILLSATLAVLLTACSNSGKKWNPDDYTVKSGDTIYAIAWRYELDVDEFSAWNKLGASSIIQPGQRLHTRKPADFVSSRHAVQARGVTYTPQAIPKPLHPGKASERLISNRTATVSSRAVQEQHSGVPQWVKARKGDTLYGISKRSGVNVERLAKLNQLKKPYTIQPGQTIFLKPLNTSARVITTSTDKTKVTNSGKTQPPTKQKAQWPGVIRWQRPAKGKVIKKFNRQRNDAKGIAIAGKLGEPIVAAAGGKVVYSGDGLISYGNLIIIKHNKTFLSAYAYNRKLLVKEGDTVKSGQKIAEMGRKDKLSSRVHFEIRKNGKPVDPLKYLPW